jgi:hypothetical protein
MIESLVKIYAKIEELKLLETKHAKNPVRLAEVKKEIAEYELQANEIRRKNPNWAVAPPEKRFTVEERRADFKKRCGELVAKGKASELTAIKESLDQKLVNARLAVMHASKRIDMFVKKREYEMNKLKAYLARDKETLTNLLQLINDAKSFDIKPEDELKIIKAARKVH